MLQKLKENFRLKVFLFKKNQRQYVYAATDRFDEFTDMRRSIRGGNFKLIYNGDTISPIHKPVVYRQQMKTMQVLDSLKENQRLNVYFSKWFSKHKDRFELYDVSQDHYELNNLILNPKYKSIFKTLQYHLFRWIADSDFGNMSEIGYA